MPVRLPLQPSTPFYRVGTVLAGVPYILDLSWNARDEAWYMDVRTEDDTLIRAGIKIVLGTFLGARIVDERFPPGLLLAADLTGVGLDATFDDLGLRVVVDFYEFEELSE